MIRTRKRARKRRRTMKKKVETWDVWVCALAVMRAAVVIEMRDVHVSRWVLEE
jgi:hypothetical protein